MKSIILTTAIMVIMMTETGLASGHVTESDIVTLESAVMMYRMQTGSLPPSDAGLSALVNRPSHLPAETRWQPLLTKLPEDVWGHPYTLVIDPGLPEGFGIYSKGPDGISRTVGNDPDDFNSWSPTSRGIETNLFKKAPWLWPSIMLACMMTFYLGVIVERSWRRKKSLDYQLNS